MRGSHAVLVAAVILAAAGCGGPSIGVVPLDVREVHRELTANVLSTGTISTASRIELRRRDLAPRYDKDPAGVLGVLHTELVAHPGNADLLYALAELSFDHAMRGGGRRHYLATVVYAYGYLFGWGAAPRLDLFDRRVRLCADLYNVALARAFASKRRGEIVLAAGERRLPFGTLEVSMSPDALVWGDRRLVGFTSAAEVGVRGLHNRHRTWGLGAPLNASTEPLDPASVAHDFMLPRARVPVTMLLIPSGDAGGLGAGRLAARLDLYAVTGKRKVEIARRTVPLEYEPTSALAEGIGASAAWSGEVRGFLTGDLMGRRLPDRVGGLEPYRPHRIPLVLVHGTVSSYVRWGEMVNDLANDPEIRRRYQFWAFTYDTGNPIVYSAMLFREALEKLVDTFDPAGRNGCLRRMVLIGHSQGGLVVRLAVSDSGDRFWRIVSDEPFDSVSLSVEDRDLLRRSLFFRPLPFVGEVIFISTPHRGSYRVDGLVRSLVRRMVRFPVAVMDARRALAVDAGDTPRFKDYRGRFPTSVDNMAPGSPFARALETMPIAPGIGAHSIIPVLGDGPLAGEKDGVVAYASAHLDGVESELVVRGSGHSTQGHPRTIEEVRRILQAHAAATFAGDDCQPPAQ